MQKKVFQLLVDNTSGVLSRIAGLFSRRGYNIESITAGVTADPRFTRITIVTSGDDDILEQIEKQVGKLVDVRDIKELDPDDSVYRELVLVKVKVDPEKRLEIRQGVEFLANNFRAKIIDVHTPILSGFNLQHCHKKKPCYQPDISCPVKIKYFHLFLVYTCVVYKNQLSLTSSLFSKQ